MVQSVEVPFFYHNRGRTNMPDELLSLKWNKHNSTFLEVLAILRDQESFVDVTLACGGKLFPAHKFILSTCSDYFREMFKRNPCKHPIVYMKDVPARDLEALLDFMYRGEVDVAQENLASLMKTAEGLQVKGLAIAEGNPMFRRDTLPPPTPPPRPPPDPSINPPAKRKRFCNDYLPISALNMFYSNMQNHHSTPEPNSPYDLSQKSSSSSSVSQSDIPANDRPNSASPTETSPHQSGHMSVSQTSDHSSNPQHLQQQASSCRASTPSSTYHNKENSLDEMKRCMPSPSPRTPQPSSSSSSSGTDSNREEGGAVPGPSGVQSGPSDDDMIAKEEIKVDDDEYGDWGGGADSVGGADSGAGSDTTGNGEVTPGYNIPPHNDCSFTNITAALDPALDLSAKSRNDSGSRGGVMSPHSLPSTPAPITTGTLLLPPRPLWPQDGNIAEEMLTCPICGKIFPKKRKSNLQVHLRTHTNERPFKCSTCGRGFKQKAHLEKHQEKSCHVMSEFVPYPFFPKAEFTP